jgi:hypothetical protein
MTARDRFFPPVKRHAPLWLALPLIAIPIGQIVLSLWEGGSLRALPCPLLFWSFAGLAICVSYGRRRLDERRHAAAARALGLRYRPRVRESDLAPFGSLSLLALSRPWDRKAYHLMVGSIEGERVVVLHLRCELHLQTREGRPVSRWFEQTVILFPDVGFVPPFFFTPDEGLLVTARAWSPALGDVAIEVDLDGLPATLRGNDERGLRRLFSGAGVEAMAPLGRWTIESAVGRLMLFQADHVFEPDEFPRYLHQSARIAAYLRSAGLRYSSEPADRPAPPHVQPAPDD